MPSLKLYSPLAAILRAANKKALVHASFFSHVKKMHAAEELFGHTFDIGGHASKEGLQRHYKSITEELYRRQAEAGKLERELANVHSDDPDVKGWAKDVSVYQGLLRYVASEMTIHYKKIMKEKYPDKEE